MRKFAVNHARLLIAVAVGLALYLVLPPQWSQLARTLVAWNATVLLLLVAIFALLARMNSAQLRDRYKEDDPTAPVILVVVIVAAILSVASIVAFLTTLKGVAPSQKAAQIVLAALTICDSWILVATVYALHYADMYYSAPPQQRPLSFPATREPVFWDFAYFSFTIAAACQTSDVSTRGVEIRKAVLAHSVISLLFNVSILGFAINVTAGLVA